MPGPLLLLAACLCVALGAITIYCNAWSRKLVTGSKQRSFFVGLVTFLSSAASSVIFWSLHYVNEDELGIAVLRVSSTQLPPERNIAVKGESGWQAEVMAPGWHFRDWPRYSVSKFPLTEVPQGSVGIVEALDGVLPNSEANTSNALAAKRRQGVSDVIVSPHVWERGDTSWLDPTAFLNEGGTGFRGLQNPPLNPGSYRLHPKLFRVIPIDTRIRSVRFGENESVTPGIDSAIHTVLDGVPVKVNVWARYQIHPSGAYKALQMLGTADVNNSVERLVRSETRIAIRSRLRSTKAADLDETSEEIGSELAKQLDEKLHDTYGISVIDIGFTSIYDPDNSGGMLTRLRTLRGEIQENDERIKAAAKELEELDARATVEKRETELFNERLVDRSEFISRLMAESDSNFAREASLLIELFDKETAYRLLVVRESASAGIPLVPQVLTDSSDNFGIDVSPILMLPQAKSSDQTNPTAMGRSE